MSGGFVVVAQHGYTRADVENGARPSLADVGAIRRPLELEQAVLDPSADLHRDFRMVRAVTKSGTVSDAIAGRQYVAIAAGNSLYAYALRP